MLRNLVTLLAAIFTLSAYGQIGYQVAVIDQTKGEPKKNAQVSVTVSISDNAGALICSESRTVTTDNMGIVSMTIGNSETFDKVNWTRLPLWVSATVDGVTISRTQVLSVPVAEYAKRTGTLTHEILCGKTWRCLYGTDGARFTFGSEGSWNYYHGDYSSSGKYYISGDTVYLFNSLGYGHVLHYIAEENQLMDATDDGNRYR